MGRDPQQVGVAFRAPLHLSRETEPAGRRLLTGTPGQVVEDITRYREVGVHHMVFDVLTTDVSAIEATIERLAQEVRPHLA